jgi:hypothetical protein
MAFLPLLGQEDNPKMHLNTEAALDYVEGRLNRDQESIWQRHLEGCQECSKVVRHWQQLGIDLKRSHLTSASEQDLENAVNIFRPPEKRESMFRSVLAAITFDSLLQPAMAGVRGTASSAARQLVMRAEEFDIHIKIWGERDHKQMLGQLLPRKGQDFLGTARFHLLRNGEKLESTTTDDMGEFLFRDIPEGELSLQIDLPNLTVIGALNLQQGH